MSEPENVSLREHIYLLLQERDLRHQQRFEAQSQAISAALLAAKEAVDKAQVGIADRLAGMNEFRGALEDKTANQVSSDKFDSTVASLMERVDAATKTTSDKIDALSKASNDKIEALASTQSERVRELAGRVGLIEGRSTGLNAGWGFLVGAGGLAIAVVGFFLAVAR